MTIMRIPRATYRLQFHAGFRLADATRLIPYLSQLGISDVYASPLLQARSGSTHGYDVTHPLRLNPELGSPEDFAAFSAELRRHGMGLLLDIVPNHMAAHGENPWWRDVLENGASSPYAGWFDIDWDSMAGAPEGKVVLPILGDHFARVLKRGELTLEFGPEGLSFCYYQTRLPVALTSYATVFGNTATFPLKRERRKQPRLPAARVWSQWERAVSGVASPRSSDEEQQAGLHAAVENVGPLAQEAVLVSGQDQAIPPGLLFRRRRERTRRQFKLSEPFHGDLPEPPPALRELIAQITTGPGVAAPRIQAAKEQLWHAFQHDPECHTFMRGRLALFGAELAGKTSSADPGAGSPRPAQPQSPAVLARLDRLLDQQHYWLTYWRAAHNTINYRRFFAISDLVAMRVERADEFRASHSLVGQWISESKVNGLRIDHIDGLHDPLGYLRRLQKELAPGGGLYVIVEKILTGQETLPPDWPVQGTSGYEFLNALNRLQVDAAGLAQLQTTYRSFIHRDLNLEDVVYGKKKQIIGEMFAADMHVLANRLHRLALALGDFPEGAPEIKSTRRLLTEITACLPLYRTYMRDFAPAERERAWVDAAVAEVVRREPALSSEFHELLERIHRLLSLRALGALGADDRLRALSLVMRWQQFTGPVMAKGFEDTAAYVYNRLVSLNEVGSGPALPRFDIGGFHHFIKSQRGPWPHSLNASSTHDTKRSEDVRARLNVLSEMSREWRAHLQRWSRLNRQHRELLERSPVPDRNDEILIYQTLLGAWPVNDAEEAGMVPRLKAYMQKAAREASVHTRWNEPNRAYEEAVARFIDRILTPGVQNLFLSDFLALQEKLARAGTINSLAQLTLKALAPGVPDFYQGCELWDLHLVDPDNRAAVDFETRSHLLGQLLSGDSDPGELLETWETGAVKMWLTAKLLDIRKSREALFQNGSYQPLAAEGPRQENICAFARRHDTKTLVVITPRLVSRWSLSPHFPLGERVWAETLLPAPVSAASVWKNQLTNELVSARQGQFSLAELLMTFPVAVLEPEQA